MKPLVRAKIFLRRFTWVVPRLTRGIPYCCCTSFLIVFANDGCWVLSRRLPRVVFPLSRALKWSCPAARFRILPLLVILNRLAMALCVFIKTMRNRRPGPLSETSGSLRLTDDTCQLSALTGDRLFHFDRYVLIEGGDEVVDDLRGEFAEALLAAAQDDLR